LTPVPKPVKQPKKRKGFAPARRKPKASAGDIRHLEAVKGLPCAVCGSPPPSQAHHVICGRYGSHKPDHRQTIPLCAKHHQDGMEAIHSGKESWVAKHGDDRDYIAGTLKLIYGFAG